ncbi:MAG: hypothetical protein J7L38_04150 [Thermoproteales archaeon]|nr:hypothetical protein [Thermoproteales archaeon]
MSTSNETKILVLILLAVTNDIVDFTGIFSPFIEFILDLAAVTAFLLVYRRLSILLAVIAFLDVLPGVDYIPFWTLYTFYMYFTEMERKNRRIKIKVE